jgi:hypothetical protein
MRKIFYLDTDLNAAPSTRIFFCEQIPLMIEMGLFKRVDKVKDADIIFTTITNIRNFLNISELREKSIVIYKPHIEKDTYLYGKNIVNSLKALFNRLLILRGTSFLFLTKATNVFYIADNRRIWRTLRNNGKKSFHLKLIPYPVYSLLNGTKFTTGKNSATIRIGCIGESSVYMNLFKNFDFEFWSKLKINIEIYASFYGPASENLIKSLAKKSTVNQINWPLNQKDLSLLYADVDFFLVPHAHFLREYGLNIVNFLSPFSNQPNNFNSSSKFSCNAGRNYLVAGLNKIFITQPTEEVMIEFPKYPYELFYEDYRDINSAILASFDPDINTKAYSAIQDFRENEYNHKFNLKQFYQWCGALNNDV